MVREVAAAVMIEKYRINLTFLLIFAIEIKPDGYVYFGIYGALYDLFQSGRIAYNDLKKSLKPLGY